MKKLIALAPLMTCLAALAVAQGKGGGNNKNGDSPILTAKGMVTPSQRKAAAARAKAKGLQVGTTAAVTTAALPGPDGHLVPDYFGVANWAFSPPLPKFVDAVPALVVATPDTTTFPGSDYYEIELNQYTVKMHSSLPATTLRGYRQTNMGGTAFSYLGPVIVAKRDVPVRIKFVNSLPLGTGGNLFIPVDPSIMGSGMGAAAPAGSMDQACNPATPPAPTWCYTQNRATVHLHGNNTVWISDGTPHQWITPADENTPYPQGVSVHPVPDMGASTAANDTGDPKDGVMTLYYTNAQSARLMFYHDHAYGITRLNVYAGEAAGYLITDAVESDLISGTNNTGVNPGLLHVLPDVGIPLVIQDKTFVDPATIGLTDPTWLDSTQSTFGTTPGTANSGDIWYPHVYVPNQNPSDIAGANAFGRWDYGVWWFPTVPVNGDPGIPGSALLSGPLPNPYCLPTPGLDCSQTPWENPEIPGTPSSSWTGEAFMDTPTVNGMAYPYLSVEPRAYRFRILNAANDRMFNLQMYVANPGIVGSLTTSAGSGYTADPVVTVANAAGDTTGHGFTVTATADVTPGSPTLGQVTFAIQSVGSNYTLAPVITLTNAPGDTTGTGASATAVLYTAPTEVGMLPIPATEPTLAPYVNSGMPDPAFAGPHWWQIGTEGGFLPAPVDVPNQHVVFNLNPKTFNFGNVLQHSLLLGSAERADVVVDFSAFAGKTIIVFNDSPAPLPAADPRNDYYTADQDQTAVGGAPTTLPGFGPNTRTIMQIRVAATATTTTPDVTLANLQAVWAKTASKKGVFEASQDPIVVPQAAYNSAYNATFPSTVPKQYLQVGQYSMTFQPIDATGALQPAVTKPVEPKAIHDEMGGVWDRYGRMSGMLGLDVPGANAQTAQFIPYGYASPPDDLLMGTVSGTLVGSLGDGTQIWSLIQNGVDTHTIHTHLVNMQLINRVGWDAMMIPPDASELGWKDTIRVNPLEIAFVAMRPVLPQTPFNDQIPNDVRLIDPTMPDGAMLNPPPLGWFDPTAELPVDFINNHTVNYGWDYVWHCHILAHEENDMMHSFVVAVPPAAPTGLGAAVSGSGKKTAVVLTWTDNSANETGFVIQRDTNTSFTNPVTFTVGPNVTTYTDAIGSTKSTYFYRVYATNVVGDVGTPNWSTMTADSGYSNLAGYPIGTPVTPPAAPTNVTASAALQGNGERVTVNWTGVTGAQTYNIQIASDSAFATIAATGTVTAPTATFTSGTVPRAAYYVRVRAANAAGASGWTNATPFPVPAL